MSFDENNIIFKQYFIPDKYDKSLIFSKTLQDYIAGTKGLNFVDKKLVKTINAFIMYKIVSFFHASIDDKKFCRINKVFKQKMIQKLKILVKNGQMLMRKSLKNSRFCQIIDEKKTLRDYSICEAGFSKMCERDCGAGFFLKKWCGTGSRPRAALI